MDEIIIGYSGYFSILGILGPELLGQEASQSVIHTYSERKIYKYKTAITQASESREVEDVDDDYFFLM